MRSYVKGLAAVLVVGVCLSAYALTGSGESASGALETLSPTMQSVSALTDASLSVIFSEPILNPGATTPANYAVSGLGAGTLSPHPDGISGTGPYTLTWSASEMQNGASVTVTATGVQDTVGNPIDPAYISASGTGIGVAPLFTDLVANPAQASVGETVTITFTSSESLAGDPSVSVNGHDATWVSGAKSVGFTYRYVIQSSDPLGTAGVSVTGFDLAGNMGSMSSDAALEIVKAEPPLSLYAWPAGLALLAAGIARLAKRRRIGMALLVLALLASTSASAQAPEVSNVTFSQSPTGGTTQVDIYYDLVAPNGPCAITVSLSKDGGADGYIHPVTSVTGDIADVTTGAGKHIVWDIRADYPEQAIPQAQLRVTADDALVPPGIDTFALDAGKAATADPVVTLNNTATNSPTEYMASEASDFSDATWQPYGTAPSFTLSSGERGTKTVYFKVRNAAGESAPASGVINLVEERTIWLPGDVPLELVWVPSGTFMMGRYPGEADSSATEDPQHQVTLAYGFWMGKYEITQQQWLAVRGTWSGYPPVSGLGLGDTYPAYYLSWNEATIFTTMLNAHIMSSGQGPLTVRLPSEAEWEYACRAGTTTRFYFGDSSECAADCTECAAGVMPGNRTDYMWYCGNNSPYGSKPVGGKLPNAFGLYDMSGNVQEFCEDDYHSSYVGAPADGSAWIDSPRTSNRVLRFGDWLFGARESRSARRSSLSAPTRGGDAGFRLAAVPTPVVSLAINSGAATTTDPEVTLDNTATTSPAEYMASEASDFSGAAWLPYGTSPSFSLSSGTGGTKTVYFKVRYAGVESAPVSDTIDLAGRTISLPGDVPLELAWVPSGSFQMGRYSGEADSFDWEDPQHPVALAYGFWMGKYEITQQQWLAVRGSWPGTAPATWYGLGNSYPAYYISWDDAQSFVTSLNAHVASSGQSPLAVRLPSEAEWEYACRAGTTTRFYFGDAPGCDPYFSDCEAGTLPGSLSDYMWYGGDDSPMGSKPVGGKLPNALGLYDMHGNVHEWCEDDSHYDYIGAPSDGSAWIEAPRTEYHMLKGGWWDEATMYCRSACRSHYPRDWRDIWSGFRLAASFHVTSFEINNAATATTNRAVTLNNVCMGLPAEYIASESASFAGAAWMPYATEPTFTLSLGVGARTVYFKVRNAGGESVVASDTIFLMPNTVPVDAGTFTMGRTSSGDDVTYGATYEDPRHDVTLGAYQLGKFEVTNKEYCDVLNWALAQGYLYADSAGTPWAGSGDIYAGGTATSRYLIVSLTSAYCNIQYSDAVFSCKTKTGRVGAIVTDYSMATHPMVMVTWHGSVAFCNWLSEWQGLTPCYDMNTAQWPLTVAPPTPGGYRLPTEAEWERAAAWDTAGGGRHWIYGFMSDTLADKNRANYYDADPGYVNPLGLTAQPYTSPVGWFDGINTSPNGVVTTMNSPSPVGAYDMSGNTYQWCHDWLLTTYYSGGSMTNPTGPATGTQRVVRGGSWSNYYYITRSAKRGSYPPASAYNSVGFRLAITN